MALNDLFEIVLDCTYLGQRSLGVYHGLRVAGGFDATNVSQAFSDHTIPELTAFTHSDVAFNIITCTNLGDPTDFAILSLGGGPGLAGGEGMPVHDCFKVQFLRQRTDMRHGWKRLVGMSEGAQASGVVLAPTVVLIDLWAAALLDSWEEAAAPGVDVANYVIVKRIKFVDPVDGKTKYRMPETDGELVTYQPVNHVIGAVSTQNTRKN